LRQRAVQAPAAPQAAKPTSSGKTGTTCFQAGEFEHFGFIGFLFDVGFAGFEDHLFFTTGNLTTDPLLERSKLERISIKGPVNQENLMLEDSLQTLHQSLQTVWQTVGHAVTISIALENCAGFGPTVTASAPPRP
jgi:hypothetical protein